VQLEPGLTASATLVVGAADTAATLGSGDVDVLGTPRVLALCEEATVAALRPLLDAGRTTVGTRVELEHLRPTRVGATVTATAVLRQVEGRRLTFDVTATEEDRVVAAGVVVRAVVERSRFDAPM
jgi:predicted thioesterase